MNPETLPALLPVTPESRAAVLRERIVLDRFPYRIGRESRVGVVGGAYQSIERRTPGAPPNNELYMLDRGERLNVSREHFQIEKTARGAFELVDRGSACGTIVDGIAVGGRDKGGRCPLREGSLIRVGTAASPFVFRFTLGG